MRGILNNLISFQKNLIGLGLEFKEGLKGFELPS